MTYNGDSITIVWRASSGVGFRDLCLVNGALAVARVTQCKKGIPGARVEVKFSEGFIISRFIIFLFARIYRALPYTRRVYCITRVNETTLLVFALYRVTFRAARIQILPRGVNTPMRERIEIVRGGNFSRVAITAAFSSDSFCNGLATIQLCYARARARVYHVVIPP